MHADGPMKQVGKTPRIALVDLARGLALIAMAIYHFAWDLEFFGYLDQGTTGMGGWRLFARTIASGFLVLVGVSLYLAHGKAIRWRAFAVRFAMVAGAALLITLVTYLAVPGGFIFFGILHQIALASLLGLAFLRLPALLTLAVAALVIALPNLWRSALFDPPLFWWLGLSALSPHSNDYVPLFPWFGAVLAGLGVAKLAEAGGLFGRLAGIGTPRGMAPVAFAGRHSLAFYLLHQPLLIAAVWSFAQLVPPAMPTAEVRFRSACERGCSATRDAAFCAAYCVCMLDRLQGAKLLDSVLSPAQTGTALQSSVQAMVNACTAETDERALDDPASP
jgi:uncharacterized membrane protein